MLVRATLILIALFVGGWMVSAVELLKVGIFESRDQCPADSNAQAFCWRLLRGLVTQWFASRDQRSRAGRKGEFEGGARADV